MLHLNYLISACLSTQCCMVRSIFYNFYHNKQSGSDFSLVEIKTQSVSIYVTRSMTSFPMAQRHVMRILSSLTGQSQLRKESSTSRQSVSTAQPTRAARHDGLSAEHCTHEQHVPTVSQQSTSHTSSTSRRLVNRAKHTRAARHGSQSAEQSTQEQHVTTASQQSTAHMSSTSRRPVSRAQHTRAARHGSQSAE